MKLRLIAFLLALMANGAIALEMAGVNIADSETLQGKTLTLNGAGVRTAFMMKIYVAALYVQNKSQDADEVIASHTPKRLLMVMKRDVKSNILLAAFRDGIRLNAAESELGPLKPRISQLEAILGRIPEAKEGDRLALDLGADGSVNVLYNDRVEDTIPGPEMGAAMLKIWLGKIPVNDDLKNALLAGSQYAKTTTYRKSAFDSLFDSFSP